MILLLAFLLLTAGARAGSEVPAPTDEPATANGPLDKLKAAGVTPFLLYYGEEFANLSGGTGRGANYEGLLKFGLTLDLEKLVHIGDFRWTGGSLYFAVLYPHGLGVTNRYVHDYNVLSNIDAYDSWRLFEAWVQQDFFDKKVSLRIGQLTTDNNFFVSDNSGLYINSAFGTIGTALHDVITPIYPVASPGVMLKIAPTPDWYFQAMVINDNPGAQDGDNKHGIRYDFHHVGALAFYELGYQHTGTDDHPILEGKYKIGGYYDSGLFPDTHSDSTHHGDYAFYFVADQQLYREKLKPKESFRGLSTFARVSFAPSDRNPVPFYWDAGLNYTGLFPGRDKDILGVAFSYERLTGDLPDAHKDLLPAYHEHILEGTYQWTVNDHFAIQPDIQYIINPGGTATIANALVAGLRITLSF